jgi:hypothetical protein
MEDIPMTDKFNGGLDRTHDEVARFGNVLYERRLYHFKFTISKAVVYSEANEVHRTGEFVRDPHEWTVIAPNRAYADLAFEDQWRRQDPLEVEVTSMPVCAEINKMRFK